MDETSTEIDDEKAPEGSFLIPESHPTTQELVAKAIAPVKKEFIRSPLLRACHAAKEESLSDKKPASNVVKEKKSKRQMKRERQQEQKSALNICPEVAKTGNTSACRYGGNCRFSHDLEAFLAQRPTDLPGVCPFTCMEEQCSFGMACRFAGSHKNNAATETFGLHNKSSEKNVLKKDVQRLLWKNKMTFTRADAQLKILGIMGKNKLKREETEEKQEEGIEAVMNGSFAGEGDGEADCFPTICIGADGLDDTVAVNDSQPTKKAKTSLGETVCSDRRSNGTGPPEANLEQSPPQFEKEDIVTVDFPEVDLCHKASGREKKLIDFRGKMYLAPLTTVGNLPFRRVCKGLGADITCGEMAMCTNLLQGQASEWALLRRHSSEDLFGVQICGAYPDIVARAVDLIDRECTVDFIDINMGCPIDIVVNKGAGSALLMKPMRMKNIIKAACGTMDKPVTVKVRTGYFEGKNRIDSLITDINNWGASAVTIHGRSRQQRYSKLADWNYVYECAKNAPDALQVLGNGDVLSYSDWNKHTINCPKLSTCMIARGALIKPWIFTEIKEQRDWDISSGERLDILKNFVLFGLEHWGSDTKGVETTRHFLLEWLSYTYRYIPVGILDVIPQRLNWRPPSYFGRDDLETLMASDSAADWIRISEMLLGPVPDGFTFAPKHKSNAYDRVENG